MSMLFDKHNDALAGLPKDGIKHKENHEARHPQTGLLNSAWFVLVPAGLVSSLAGVLENSPAIPVFTCLIFFITLCMLSLVRLSPHNRNLFMSIFAWAFLLRIVYAIALYYWLLYSRGEPFLGGGDDALYEAWSEQFFARWQQADFYLPPRHPGYPFILVLIRYAAQYVGGYHTMLPPLINACVGGLLAAFTFRLAYNIYGHATAVIAGLIVAVFPSLIYYSSVQLRDIIIAFLFVLAAFHVSQFVNCGRISSIASAILAAAILLYFRVIYGYLVFGALGLSLLACLVFQHGRSTRNHRLKIVTFAAGTFILAAYLQKENSASLEFITGNDAILQPFEQEGFIADKIDARRSHGIAAADEMSLGRIFQQHLPFGIGLAILPMIALIMPYPPWAALYSPSPLMLILLINNLAWTVVMPLCIIGMLVVIRKRFPENLVILLPMIFLYIALTGNFTDRYKLPALPFVLIFGAIGWSWIRHNQAGYRCYFGIQIGLLALYGLAKAVITLR